MIMCWIWVMFLLISVLASVLNGTSAMLSASIPEGAQAGITLAISMAGSLCLWTGVGRLMEKAGFTRLLSKLLAPVLSLIFPGSKRDHILAGHLSANVCANFLGLGNAATPMGIQAAKRMASRSHCGIASDELCRLIVLNTASIQLIPANVAAIRSSLGCASPFDILPAVWMTSICSAAAGLTAAKIFGKVWKK